MLIICNLFHCTLLNSNKLKLLLYTQVLCQHTYFLLSGSWTEFSSGRYLFCSKLPTTFQFSLFAFLLTSVEYPVHLLSLLRTDEVYLFVELLLSAFRRFPYPPAQTFIAIFPLLHSILFHPFCLFSFSFFSSLFWTLLIIRCLTLQHLFCFTLQIFAPILQGYSLTYLTFLICFPSFTVISCLVFSQLLLSFYSVKLRVSLSVLPNL